MKRGTCICECGHWSDRHPEEWNEETHESFHPCSVRGCDCDDFRPDDAMMKDLENEAKQLRFDAERGK